MAAEAFIRMKRAPSLRKRLLCSLLALADSSGGAGASASTAIDAGISVDNVLAIALGNSAYGTFCCAASAATRIIDNVCHWNYLLNIMSISGNILTTVESGQALCTLFLYFILYSINIQEENAGCNV